MYPNKALYLHINFRVMKKLCFLFLFLHFSTLLFAQIPNPHKGEPYYPEFKNIPTNDFNELLIQAEEDSLNQKMQDFFKKTNNQIAIATIPLDWMQPTTVEDYANTLARKWGLGQSGNNNGVLILIVGKSGDPVKKLRIEVGYGLEATLTDATCKKIETEGMVPELKNGNYYRALNNGLDAVIQTIKGEVWESPLDISNKDHPFNYVITYVFLFFTILVLVLFMLIVKEDRARYLAKKNNQSMKQSKLSAAMGLVFMLGLLVAAFALFFAPIWCGIFFNALWLFVSLSYSLFYVVLLIVLFVKVLNIAALINPVSVTLKNYGGANGSSGYGSYSDSSYSSYDSSSSYSSSDSSSYSSSSDSYSGGGGDFGGGGASSDW